MGILRFLLAFSVLIGHSDHSLGLPGLHTTVAVRSFYVISGFYMTLVLKSKYQNKPYYVFLRSRYLRLFPAYFIILMLTFIYGLIVYSIRGTVEWPLQGWCRTLTELDVKSIFALSFSNIFILGQDILSFFSYDQSGNLQLLLPEKNLNSAVDGYMLVPQAWTLGVELLFYIAAPFFVTRSAALISAVMLVSLALKHLLFPALSIPPEAMGYRFFPFELIYFALGALAFNAYEILKSYRAKKEYLFLVTAVLLFLYAAPQSGLPGWARYLSLAACIPFVFSLSKDNRVDRLIGELSYPMYISHILIFYMLTQFTTWGTEGPGIVLTIILSFLIYYLVDKNLDRWRETLPSTSPRRFPSARTIIVCSVTVCLSLAAPLAAQHVMRAKHLERSLALSPCDLLQTQPKELVTVGLEPVESSGASSWRWGLGPKTEMLFSLPHPVNIILTVEYAPLPPGQTATVIFNGTVLENLANTAPGTIYRQYVLPGRKENNVIRIDYQDWNGRQTVYVPADSRPLAVAFTKLGLAFVAPR